MPEKNKLLAFIVVGIATTVLVAGSLYSDIRSVSEDLDDLSDSDYRDSDATDYHNVPSDFLITTEIGVDGFVRYQYPFNVCVTVTNTKEDFTGTLRLIPVREKGYEAAAYGRDLVLRKGEEQSYTIELPVRDANESIYLLQIADSRGHTVHSEQLTEIEFFNEYTFVMGILSDDFEALHFFNDRDAPTKSNATYIWNARVRLFELNERNMPENGETLKNYQLILINDFDTARLSDRQYQALIEWVNSGGVLLIGTGADGQDVFHQFDGLISGTAGGLTKTSLTIGEETVHGVDVLNYQMADAEPLPDAGTGTGGKSLEHFKAVGLGRVVVLGYNLGAEPLSSWSGRENLAEMLIRKNFNWIMDWTTRSADPYYYTEDKLPVLMDNPRRASQLVYGLLLAVYAVAVGPVLYRILKKNKKQEKIWLMVAVTASAFTGLVYLTSFYYKIRNPVINSFAVIRLHDHRKTEEVKSEITVPESRAFSISFAPEYRNFAPYWNSYGNHVLAGGYQYTVKDGENIILDFEEVSTVRKIQYSVEKYAENDIGTLDLDIRFFPTHEFTGTITNNTNSDLQEVTIRLQEKIYVAGDLNKGQTHQIVGSDIQTVYYPADFLGRYDVSTDASLLNEMQAYMWSDYVSEVFQVDLCSVWGLMEEYGIHIADDRIVKQNSGALVVQQYLVDYRETSGVYFPDITAMQLGSNKAEAADDNGEPDYLRSNYVTRTYDFGETVIDTLWLDRSNSNNESAAVFAYNNKTKLFEQIFVDKDKVDLLLQDNYLKDGQLVLQYRYPAEKSAVVYFPCIAAWQKGE